MNGSGSKRVLVLGSSGHGRHVTAYHWTALPGDLNVADYDVVVLNFSTLDDEEVRKNVPLDRLPSTEQFTRLIFSAGSVVIAVGSPNAKLGETTRGPWREATWWLPVELPTKSDSGEIIRDIAEELEFWFDKLTRYTWHFWASPAKSQHAGTLFSARAGYPRAETFIAQWLPLASTRAGDPIAVRLELMALWRGRDLGGYGDEVEVESAAAPGTVLWLPAPTKITAEEAIDLMLRNVLGIVVETAPPDWLARYSLPQQDAARQDVKEKQATLRTAFEAHAAAEAREASEARFGRLLYEQGKEALEPVVRDALAALSATVSEPQRAGAEDGRLEDPHGARPCSRSRVALGS
jgi:hypothetical protein